MTLQKNVKVLVQKLLVQQAGSLLLNQISFLTFQYYPVHISRAQR